MGKNPEVCFDVCQFYLVTINGPPFYRRVWLIFIMVRTKLTKKLMLTMWLKYSRQVITLQMIYHSKVSSNMSLSHMIKYVISWVEIVVPAGRSKKCIRISLSRFLIKLKNSWNVFALVIFDKYWLWKNENVKWVTTPMLEEIFDFGIYIRDQFL